MRGLRSIGSSSVYALLLFAAVSVQSQNSVSQDSSTRSPLAQTTDPVPPPLSVHRAQFFKNNPAARTEFFSHLPRQSASRVQPASPGIVPPASGTWQVAVNPF